MPVQNGLVPLTREPATSKSSTSTFEVANAAKTKTKPESANGPTKVQPKATLEKDDQKPVANGPVSNTNAATPSVQSQTQLSASLPAVSKPPSASSATTAKSIRVSFSDGGEPPHAPASLSSPYPIVTEAVETTASKKPEQKKPKRSKSQRDAAKGSSAPSSAAGAESSAGGANPPAPSASEPAPSLVNGFSHDAEPAVPFPFPVPVPVPAVVREPEAAPVAEQEPEPLEDASSLVDDVTLDTLHTDPSVVSVVVKSPAGDQTATQTSAEHQLSLSLARGVFTASSITLVLVLSLLLNAYTVSKSEGHLTCLKVSALTDRDEASLVFLEANTRNIRDLFQSSLSARPVKFNSVQLISVGQN